MTGLVLPGTPGYVQPGYVQPGYVAAGTAPRPFVARGGAPMLPGQQGSTAAPIGGPVIGPGSAELEFQAATRLADVPRVNDQFENFGVDRDWAFCFNHPTEGFAGIRWQPTWKRADGYYGSWEPAEGEVYRIQRKGETGQDARTLAFTLGPNPSAIPVGDSVVVWEVPGYDGGVAKTTTFNLSGYNLPLRQKLTVTASQGSATYDADGRRIVEVDAGQVLPAIDYTVGDFDASWWRPKLMRMRHWSFYADEGTKRLRHPLGWFKYNSIDLTLANGGDIMLGGLQGIPTWYDWTEDHRNFGASLVEELWRKECDALAFEFGATDPRRLAVELENEPTRPWRGNSTDGPGYGDLLPDVWYGYARRAWGKDRTLVVKATGFGGLDSLRDDFDWTCPTGDLAHLVTHQYQGSAHLLAGAGGDAINFQDIGQTDWYADRVKEKIVQFGFRSGGMTEGGHGDFEFWDYNLKISDAERGRRYGRLNTSMHSRGLYFYCWGATGDGYHCISIRDLGGRRVESYYDSMAPYCRRAAITTV